MESFKLDVATLLAQQIHHELEIVRVTDIARHSGEIVPIQQQVSQQLCTICNTIDEYTLL